MAKFDELIQQYCPNGVEYKPIHSFADTNIGLATSVTAHKTTEGVLLLHNSDIQQNKIVLKNVEYISSDFAQKNSKKLFKYHDIITVHTGDVGTSAVIEDEYVGCIGFTTITTRIREFELVNPYYLSHFLNSEICKSIIATKSISDRNNLNQKEFEVLEVPVPPLPVQEEIVRILDAFTELETKLEAELETELELRLKQYEHYRDRLLSLEDYEGEVIETTLSAVAHYSKDRIDASELNENNYVGVDNMLQEKRGITTSTAVPTAGTWTKFNKNDVLIGNIRPYLRKIWMADKEGGTNGDVIVYRSNDEYKLHPRYLYHILASEDFFNYDNSKSKGAKMPRGNKEMIPLYQIRIPKDINEQIRIAGILDKFDRLTTDISEGLPAEIKMRHQQYEYFRDRLLRFKRIETN